MYNPWTLARSGIGKREGQITFDRSFKDIYVQGFNRGSKGHQANIRGEGRAGGGGLIVLVVLCDEAKIGVSRESQLIRSYRQSQVLEL